MLFSNYLTNPAMKESKAYNTYHDLATRKMQPKPKYVRRSSRTKTDEAPKPSSGKRVKATAKVAKSGKKKQPALGLETLSDIALTEAEQMKLAIKRSKTQLHISQPSGSGVHEGTGVTPGVPDVPTYESNDEKISWKSSEEEDNDEENVSEHEDDDDDELTESDDDGDDFVHPKFSTHDGEAKQDEEVNEEDIFDPRVQTPSHVESIDDEDSDDVIQDANVKGDMINEEETYEEVEANVLYRDVNINLEGRDTMMTDSSLPNVQATQETEDTHVILTALINPEGQQQSSSVSSGFVSNMLNPRPDTGIDSIFNLNTEATSLVDVSVTTIAEPPLVFATTLPPPPTSLIIHMQQTPFPKPTIVPSSSLQDLPNFGSLFRLRDEAQAENEDFLNKLDENIKKIIKDQVKEQVKAQVSKILPRIEKTVNEQLEAEVMTRLSTKSKTSLAIAANLSELELKKILIKKMESNKRKDDEDKDEEPSAGSNWGSKRRRAEKEPESTSAPKEKASKTTCKSTDGSKSQHKFAAESAQTEEPMHTDKDLEEPTYQEFDIGATKEQFDKETSQHPDCNLARKEGPRESFNELMDTPLDFSAIMMNRLKIDTLTPELLVDPTFELMKGTCKSLVELEYFFEEVYKATTDRLDWHNPKGQEYPHDLQKPLSLIPNSRGRQVIPFDHFINNDLAYLFCGVSSRTYATFVTKTKAADYGHIKWIEDLVRNTIWSEVPLTNLNVEDRLAFGVSLRMFTRSIVIQRRVEDLQLGVESYQKKLNITNPDTYRSDLKCRDAYTAYSNPRGFIYQNKDKKNKLMRIDELHKFSDGTLDDIRTALNDHLKGIRMEYLTKKIWRQSDRE
ncbi:hypothetical protein Tco_0738501 [Tanacetum coccineum]